MHNREHAFARLEQDEGLELLATSVERLGHMGRDINAELKTQDEMLSGIEAQMDETTMSIDLVTKQTNKLIEKSGGLKWFSMITVLGLVALILFYLVVFV